MQEYESSVLEQYDMDVRSTRKIRGAVLCDTDQGFYLVKELTVSSERLGAISELYEYLGTQEWCSVDQLIKNREGNYISALENGDKYIVKRWFSGRECDIRKSGEILDAAGMLAKFHLIMRRKMEHPVSEAESIAEEYKKHNRELKKVRSYIRKSSPKTEFEMEFLKSFDEMFQWAQSAGDMLDESDYRQLYQSSREENSLTHGDYNYHNIIMDTGDRKNTLLAVTNFDKFRQDIQVEDFYYFLRKVMEKNGWKERLGDSMINAYSAVKPLTGQEIEYLKIRLVYPEKFWKTANAYYHSNKAWMPAKSIEKLGIAIRQTKEKERFLKNVFGVVL